MWKTWGKRVAAAGCVGMVAAGSAGCTATTAVVAQRKNAYIVKGSVFSSAMYHCQVEISGKPVCTEVTEVE